MVNAEYAQIDITLIAHGSAQMCQLYAETMIQTTGIALPATQGMHWKRETAFDSHKECFAKYSQILVR